MQQNYIQVTVTSMAAPSFLLPFYNEAQTSDNTTVYVLVIFLYLLKDLLCINTSALTIFWHLPHFDQGQLVF